jgi:RNA polymerase sigma-70 factor (sigma-E family)
LTFDEFLDTQLGPLTRYARVLSGDRQSAHDLVADTLVAASKRWDNIGQLDLPAAYVRRMLTNRHIDQGRRHRIIRWTHQLPGENQLPAVSDATNGIHQRGFLDGLLRELPARQRAALVYRFYLGLSDDEIADELDMKVGSVRSAISRGLATLRTKTTVHDVRTNLDDH